MAIFKKITNDNTLEKKKYRNKELTLAMALGATVGLLTGIAVNSKSDKIDKIIKKIKNKSIEYIDDGKNKIEDLLKEK
ncbi:hypothetical protein R0131_08130 [Clostridium sp. AL.422]|uniref:hypothetical protein n=1 Tax=Clostridium TaxID=1485 RepID=UPI00293DD116|nr:MULTISPECIES: hypothetical protein [unclassified Clostridium]MDV4150799.1 hypothetical protein [Clostridium sp. AL.422]